MQRSLLLLVVFISITVVVFASSNNNVHLQLSGYNGVWGPVITNLPYDDPSSLELTRRLNTGGIRFPGGSVANYWNLSSGEYTSPCDSPLSLFGNNCQRQRNITHNGLKMKFTAENFVRNVVAVLASERKNNNSKANNTSPLPVTFVLNLFTLTQHQNEMLRQVDLLATTLYATGTVPRSRPLLIELGNEYFIDISYGKVYPNIAAYLNVVKLMSQRIRQKLPTARIAVVADPTNGAWMDGLAAARQADTSLFDAVTVHDYNCEYDPVTQPESIALCGAVRVPELALKISAAFGNSASNNAIAVWNTEFNVNPVTMSLFKAAGQQAEYGVLHSIFELTWRMTAICDATTQVHTWEIVYLHMLWQQSSMQSSLFVWLHGWAIAQLRDPNNSTSQQPLFSAMGQVASKVGSLSSSSSSSSSSSCLSFDGHQSKQLETNVSCLRGLRFDDANNKTTFLIVNGCDRNISTALPLLLTSSSAHVIVRQSWVSHRSKASGQDELQPLSNCSNESEADSLWRCGPARVSTKQWNVTEVRSEILVQVPALSIVFVEL